MTLPSHDFIPPSIEELATLLPAYDIQQLIAKGGMGAVYKANQKSLERLVAIKILPRHYGKDKSFREAFEKEAKAMAKFNHSNLISVYDFGQVDELLYIIMEYVAGESLYHSTYNQQVEPDKASSIITGICNGIEHAHKHGILHRDIKPANIFLDSDSFPKIGDFGLARALKDHASDQAFGTPGYTAPEVVNSPTSVCESTDLYSIGVVLYKLLTNQPLQTPYIPAATIVNCDPRFDNIILKATHPSPSMRYKSASDIVSALDKIKAPSAASSPPLKVKPATSAPNPLLQTSNTAAPTTRTAPVHIPAEKSHTVRNILIITVLGACVYTAWQGLEYQKNKNAAEKAQLEKDAAALATNPLIPTGRIIAPENEAIEISLKRLKTKLQQGDFSEMPYGTFSINKRSRLYIETPMSWNQAQRFCENFGGYLAVTPTENNLSQLLDHAPADKSLWLGAGTAGKNKWSWVNGTSCKLDIRDTVKPSYVITDNKGHLAPKPATEKHSFFIEWDDTRGTKANLTDQLAKTSNTLTSGNAIYPPGTVEHKGHHYLFVNLSIPWKGADAIAKSAGGYLASADQLVENSWMLNLANSLLKESQACWIGGIEKNNAGWNWSNQALWKIESWATGFPKSHGTSTSACAIVPGKKWKNYLAYKELDYFLIEWEGNKTLSSASNTEVHPAKNTPVPAVKAPVKKDHPQIISTRSKCSELVAKTFKAKKAEFTANTKSYLKDLTRIHTSASPTLQKSYQEPYDKMKKALDGVRIDPAIGEIELPTVFKRTLDEFLKRQDEIDDNIITDTEKLRGLYIKRLNEFTVAMRKENNLDAVNQSKQEIERSSNPGMAFVEYMNSIANTPKSDTNPFSN